MKQSDPIKTKCDDGNYMIHSCIYDVYIIVLWFYYDISRCTNNMLSSPSALLKLIFEIIAWDNLHRDTCVFLLT